MSVQVWPSVLPLPSQAYNVEPEAIVSRLAMDSGRSRQIASATQKLHFMQVSWEFTDIQFEVFVGFYNVVLRSGVDEFSMEMAVGGNACENLVCKFTGDYKANNSGSLNWKVSAEVEVSDVPIPTITSHVINLQNSLLEPPAIAFGYEINLASSILEPDLVDVTGSSIDLSTSTLETGSS